MAMQVVSAVGFGVLGATSSGSESAFADGERAHAACSVSMIADEARTRALRRSVFMGAGEVRAAFCKTRAAAIGAI